ncbi:hypothetical protein BBP13_12735 [Limosilactobacillus reuteri]|nr:hypothetical protein BBP13_12735 [Limosilactobacillus reuteri]
MPVDNSGVAATSGTSGVVWLETAFGLSDNGNSPAGTRGVRCGRGDCARHTQTGVGAAQIYVPSTPVVAGRGPGCRAHGAANYRWTQG